MGPKPLGANTITLMVFGEPKALLFRSLDPQRDGSKELQKTPRREVQEIHRGLHLRRPLTDLQYIGIG